LPLIVLFSIVTVPLLWSPPPPSSPADSLPLIVLFRSASVPTFLMPPPSSKAAFPLTAQLLTVSVPALWRPPSPSAMVNPASTLVTPGVDREHPPACRCPLMVRFVAPGPRRLTSLRSTSPPLVSTMVCPFKAGAKLIVPPGQMSTSACRKLPTSLSLAFTTVMAEEHGPVPVPRMAKVYTISPPVGSLLVMLNVAVRGPVKLGSKVTWNVLALFTATGEAGWAFTVKSTALGPLTATLGTPLNTSGAVPRFVMVKLRTTVPLLTAALPKSVPSATPGVVSPSRMLTPLPVTLISGSTPVPWMAKL
jgi:hypothetical protein